MTAKDEDRVTVGDLIRQLMEYSKDTLVTGKTVIVINRQPVIGEFHLLTRESMDRYHIGEEKE